MSVANFNFYTYGRKLLTDGENAGFVPEFEGSSDNGCRVVSVRGVKVLEIELKESLDAYIYLDVAP